MTTLCGGDPGRPAGGRAVVFDLGFFSFLWFDDFTEQQQSFVTRMREKTASRTVQG